MHTRNTVFSCMLGFVLTFAQISHGSPYCSEFLIPESNIFFNGENIIFRGRIINKSNVNDVNKKIDNDDWQRTPLMEASRIGDVDIVRKLIQFPTIKINIQDKGGNTALMYAVRDDLHFRTLSWIDDLDLKKENEPLRHEIKEDVLPL